MEGIQLDNNEHDTNIWMTCIMTNILLYLYIVKFTNNVYISEVVKKITALTYQVDKFNLVVVNADLPVDNMI